MNVLVDENLSPSMVQRLAAKGVVAVHVAHIGMPGATDPQVWKYAYEHDQIVVTMNVEDFLHLASGVDLHPGPHRLARRRRAVAGRAVGLGGAGRRSPARVGRGARKQGGHGDRDRQVQRRGPTATVGMLRDGPLRRVKWITVSDPDSDLLVNGGRRFCSFPLRDLRRVL